MKKLMLITMLVGFLAAPALGNLTNPRPVGTASDVLQVQGIFDTIGSSLNALTDQSNAAIFSPMAGGSSAATYIATVSWNLSVSAIEFGIYEYGDTSNSVKLFDVTTSSSPGDSVSFGFDPIAGTVISFDPGGTIDSTTSYFDDFGFYVNSTRGTYYSEDNLNGNLGARMLTYEGNGDNVTIGGLTGSDSEHWYIASEANNYSLGTLPQTDFSDVIVLVESITPTIPAPGAVLLGSLGVAMVGWLRRRRSL